MRVIAGPEKKTRVMSEKERLITAYHEVGHAIVGQLLQNTDPVHKISIISRGQALGYTISLPTEDKFLTTRAELTDTMAMTLGGRAAEEIVFGEITTGASNDLEKVTETAKQMVMRFGMSERLGPRVFGHDRGQPFLGREFSSEPDYSDEIAREIDDEIRRIVESAHQTAKSLLNERREELERISKLLLERETIDAERVRGAARRQARRRGLHRRRGGAGGTGRARRRARTPSARVLARIRARAPASPAATRPDRRLAASSVARVRSTLRSLRPRHAWSGTRRDQTDGGRQRDPRLVLRRGAVPRSRGGDRARARAGGGGGGDPRRRRRIDSAGGGGGGGRGGAAAGRAGDRGAGRGRGAAISIDTSKARGRRGGARRRGGDRQRRHRAARRPGDGGAVRRARRDGGPHAHARRARGRCRTTRATTTSSTRSRRSSPSGSRSPLAAGDRRGADLARSRDRLRQDRRAQPRAAAAARRAGASSGRPLVDRDLAQELHRPGRRLRRRTSGSAARSPPRSSPPPRAPTVLRVHDVAEMAQALAVADGDTRIGSRAWRLRVHTATASSRAPKSSCAGSRSTPTTASPTPSRRSGQRLEFDISFDVPDCDAVLTDRLEDTVDYAEVCDIVALAATERSYRTLERLAQVVGERLMERYGCDSVRVRAAKPEPPLPLAIQEVAVEVTQERAGRRGRRRRPRGSAVANRLPRPRLQRRRLRRPPAGGDRAARRPTGSRSRRSPRPTSPSRSARSSTSPTSSTPRSGSAPSSSPKQLLDVCKAIEAERGRSLRRPPPRPAPARRRPAPARRPRAADRAPDPAAPRGRPSRRFVLVPLLELDPELTLPDGTRLADALAALPAGPARRTGSGRSSG